MTRIQRLNERYHQLRRAGYTNAEATRLKHRSRATIEYMIQHADDIIGAYDPRRIREQRIEEGLSHAETQANSTK